MMIDHHIIATTPVYYIMLLEDISYYLFTIYFGMMMAAEQELNACLYLKYSCVVLF